jgi:hypothetical protein
VRFRSSFLNCIFMSGKKPIADQYASRRFLRVGLALALFFPAMLWGQATGSFAGNVADKSGPGLAGASVTVTAQETGQVRAAKTDSRGTFWCRCFRWGCTHRASVSTTNPQYGLQPQGTPCNKIPANLINSVGQGMINIYPTPNAANAAGGYNYINEPVRSLNETKFDVRLDDTLTSKDNSFGRFSYDQVFSFVPVVSS